MDIDIEKYILQAQRENVEVRTAEINEGDYLKGGLLYCGKCKAPKQIKFRGIIVRCLCKCEVEARFAEEEAEQKAALRKKIAFAREDCFNGDVSAERLTFTLDDSSDSKASTIARRYAKQFGRIRNTGGGLIFYGSVGTGKTFYSACICNELLENGYKCKLIKASELIGQMHHGYGARDMVLKSLESYDLVVLDDLASEFSSEYVQAIVFDIVDSRYKRKQPIIVTTNMTVSPEGVKLLSQGSIQWERIFSRLIERCVPIRVQGQDRRKGASADKDELLRLLDLDN